MHQLHVHCPGRPRGQLICQRRTLAGTLYRYRAQAFNAGGNSAYSPIAEATTPPSAPGALTATTVSATQVQLRWSDTTGETEFRVERCAGAGCTSFTPIAGSPVALNVIALLDTSAQSGTRYRYRIYAFNAGGLSAASAIVEATTWPNAPTGLVARPHRPARST